MNITNTIQLQSRRAFTLIELLTVIAIIGILAAILIPVVASVRESARSSRCVGNLRALGYAMIVFLDEHDGRIEIWRQGNESEGRMWTSQLDSGGYLGSREILVCPSRHPFDWDSGGTWPWTHRAYGFNMIESLESIQVSGNLLWFNANGIEDTSRHFLFADSFKVDNSGGSGTAATDGQSQRFRIPSWAPTANLGGVHTRHGSKANMVFLDGHVSSKDARQLRDIGFMTYVNEDDRRVPVPFN